MKNKITMFLLITVFIISGCASSATSRTETTTRTIEGSAVGNRGNFPRTQVEPDRTEEKRVSRVDVDATEVRTTEVRQKKEGAGVIATTFNFIGAALAFPFKLIAGVIEFIF